MERPRTYENDGRGEDGPFARVAIRRVAEDDDTDDFADEDERGDVALRIAGRILVLVKLLQDGVDRANDLRVVSWMLSWCAWPTYAIEIAVGEESGAARNDGSTTLPPGLLRFFVRDFLDKRGGAVLSLLTWRLESAWVEDVVDGHGERMDGQSGSMGHKAKRRAVACTRLYMWVWEAGESYVVSHVGQEGRISGRA